MNVDIGNIIYMATMIISGTIVTTSMFLCMMYAMMDDK